METVRKIQTIQARNDETLKLQIELIEIYKNITK
jgi:hypothetical protein